MSYKTDRLAALFPQAYAAAEQESLLYRLLDAVGAEHMQADEAIKDLLKSHWVNYASGAALDGLGAIYGVSRRTLRDGSLETDPAFRLRLKAVVPLFTGGGTVRAIRGAVRSALGLPFDLDQLGLPSAFAQLRQDIEDLVRVEEFSPQADRVISDSVTEVDGASELILEVDIPTVRPELPQLEWTFTSGGARRISLERLDTGMGIKTTGNLVVPEGTTLRLSARDDGRLRAVIDLEDVTTHFVNLDDSSPAMLPEVPQTRSEWKFRAHGGFDISQFDSGESFDLPLFRIEMLWVRYQPMTFDVYVPYFLQTVVNDLKQRYGYTGNLFVFQGLPLDRIQEVVDQTRAAGVRGSVHFSLQFLENHAHRDERPRLHGDQHVVEDTRLDETLLVGSVNKPQDIHELGEQFAIGGVFDISTFDQSYGFVE